MASSNVTKFPANLSMVLRSNRSVLYSQTPLNPVSVFSIPKVKSNLAVAFSVNKGLAVNPINSNWDRGSFCSKKST